MSVMQNNSSELRYLRRQSLDQEARVIGNYYRDIIRSYGVDVNYYKLNTNVFGDFKGVVDQNVLLKHAYGYEISPDYSISAQMLSYMEVEQDVFQINKFGYNPDAAVSFYFDSNDFACALASKLGQYREIKIDETEVVCEVPELTDESVETDGNKVFLSSYTFPYKLGFGMNEFFCADVLSGKFQTEIDRYEVGKETTVPCDVYEHSLLSSAFKANPDLYKTFWHSYQNNEYLETMLFLTFTVDKTVDAYGKHKFILHGKLHGNVLFYDLNKVGKYMDKIHPEVGDIVTIDFPDEKNREQYEITDAFDKQLQSDGISPLLHKYIWKCTAKRHIDNYDNVESNDANDILEEKTKYQQAVDSHIANELQMYDDNQDAAYGGYGNVIFDFDKNTVYSEKQTKYEWIDDGTAIDIMTFECGSKLMTTGYELLFMTDSGDVYKLTTVDHDLPGNAGAYAESNLKYLKATDDALVYTNILGDSYKIVENEEVTDKKVIINIESLLDKTTDDNKINSKTGSFYKFRNTRTYLFATRMHLFCKLAGNKKTYQLV